MTQLLQRQQPQYFAVANELMEDILSGRLAVGDQLPSEPELVKKYKLSRYSVRLAIKALMDLGLVSRQQGIGTRVLANQTTARYTQTISDLNDIARYAQDTHFRITSKNLAALTPEEQSMLHSSGTGRWLHLTGLRSTLDRGAPISLVDIYVSPKYVKLPNLSQTLNVPVHALIEREFGLRFTRVDQEIQGTVVNEKDAVLLKVKGGTAGLRITRTYYVRDEVIEVTVGVHPAERFSYTMSFQLDVPQ